MDEMQQQADTAIAAAGVPDEAALRALDVPRFDTETDLLAFIHGLVERPHDYGTCVYAMSLAAAAAFYYVSRKLGVTGFQAGCADLDFLSRVRGYKYGCRVIDYDEALYPQYWDDAVKRAAFQAAFDDGKWREKFRAAAQQLLATEAHLAVPAVVAHWRTLAAGQDVLRPSPHAHYSGEAP